MGYVGQMTKRASFLIHQPVSKATGGREDSFGLLLTCFGALEKMSGRRGLEEGQSQWENRWRLRVRFQSSLESGIGLRMRAVVDNRSFMIDSYTLVGEKQRYYEFILRESDRVGGAITLPPTIGAGGGGLYSYVSVAGGETSIQSDDLIGKNILNVARSTNNAQIIFTGTPTGSQAKFTSSTGTVDLGSALGAGEWIQVIYG